MATNDKKPLVLLNRTKYFVPDKDRVRVVVESPKTFRFGRSKIEGYESRLYYEFKRSQELGGETFFYTLTYSDANVPTFMGQTCFDYEDLRYLLNGGFKKYLLRKYAISFRYFVGAELGDGKGRRGLHNNPHYHILFFLRPSEIPVYVPYVYDKQVGVYTRGSSKHPKGSPKIVKVHEKRQVFYQKITPKEFRHAIRMYWQGFDEDEGFFDYRCAKYGIAKEGRFDMGLVKDFRAIMYVAKYATKDSALIKHEFAVKQQCAFEFELDYKDSFKSYADFLHTVIYYKYNIPLNARRSEWQWSDKELCWRLVPKVCERFKLFEDWLPSWVVDCTKAIIKDCHLENDYEQFVKDKVEEYVNEKIVEFRNRYSNKVRISQEVGTSALDEIEDNLHPSIRVPDNKQGFKNRPLGLYLYRKLYTEVYTDTKGNTTRILNDLGIRYKLATLEDSLSKMRITASSHLNLVLHDRELYEKMYNSDVNVDVTISFDRLVEQVNELVKEFDISDIIDRYVKFKYIYENRFIEVQSDRLAKFNLHSSLDYVLDYSQFLQPSAGTVRRSDNRLSLFLADTSESYLPYSLLPYFNRFLFLFGVLDLCSDYFFIADDDKKQDEAIEIANVRRLHKRNEMRQYYASMFNFLSNYYA